MPLTILPYESDIWSKAELAFTLHMRSWFSTSGTTAKVEFPGVLYRSGNKNKLLLAAIEDIVANSRIW